MIVPIEQKAQIFDAINKKNIYSLKKVKNKYFDFIYHEEQGNLTPLQHALKLSWYDGCEYILQNDVSSEGYMTGKDAPAAWLLACLIEGDQHDMINFLKLLVKYRQPITSTIFECIYLKAKSIGYLDIANLMYENKKLINFKRFSVKYEVDLVTKDHIISFEQNT